MSATTSADRNHRRALVFCTSILATGLMFAASQGRAELVIDNEQNRERLMTYVGMFNELADRRRKVVYVDYPVSPLRGVVYNFVHVSDGTAAFARTDLVVDASLPIVIRRAYHSDRSGPGQFGEAGWRLSIDERILERDDGTFEYRYGNGAMLVFDRRGRISDRLDAFLSDVVEMNVENSRRLSIETRTGISKRFNLIGGEYRLSRVVDAYGNSLKFSYEDGRLTGIESADGPYAHFAYDDLGRITAVQDSTGRRVAYAYDENGRLAAVVDVREQAWQYHYGDGRLIRTITPNGHADLEFAYDDSGHVRKLFRNGVPFTFQYRDNRTHVIDARSNETVFQAEARGVTQSVVNSSGTVTSIKFNRQGLPSEVLRNDDIVARLRYRDGSTVPRQILFDNQGVKASMQIDRRGRVSEVDTGDAASSYRVRYSAGLVPTAVQYGSDVGTFFRYDDHGELAAYSDESGRALTFLRDGAELNVNAENGRSAKLLFNKFGQLEKALPATGDSVSFAYDQDGFRSATRTSGGIEVDYRYDSTGNLFSTVVASNDFGPEVFTYQISNHNRLDRITTDGSLQAEFDYGPSGLPISTSSPLMISLSFDHDKLGRLTRITPQGGAPLDYDYALGEPSITVQLDRMTSESAVQQKEISDFGSRMDVFLSRIVPSHYGYLTFDKSSQELTLFVDPANWSPDLRYKDLIINTRVYELLADDGPNYSEFAKPSNRYFIPPELWAINCCFCCPGNLYDCEIP